MTLRKKSKNSMVLEDGMSEQVFQKGDFISFQLKDGNSEKGPLYEIRDDGFAILKDIFGVPAPAGLFLYDWIQSIHKEA